MSMMTRGAWRKQQEKNKQEERKEEDKEQGMMEDDDSDTTVVTKGSRKRMTEEERIARGLIVNKKDDEDEIETKEAIKWTRNCISSSWVNMDNYVDHIVFIPFTKRLPTKFWFVIDDQLRKTNPGYTVKEIQFAKQSLLNAREDAKKFFKVEDDRRTVGKIAKKLAKIVQRKEYKENATLERFVLMSIRMAGTEEYILDDANFLYDDLRLIKEMWIVGQQIFGNVCDTNEKKISEFRYIENEEETKKDLWKKLKELNRESFRKEDFMDVNGEHPWKILEDINVDSGLNQMCSSVEEWELAVVMNLNEGEPNEVQIRNIKFMVKMANTPPEQLPGWNSDKKTLDLNQFTVAWVAVYNTLGRTWKKEVKWDKKSITTKSTATIHPKRVKKKQKKTGDEDNANVQKRIGSKKVETIDWFVKRDNEVEEVITVDQTWSRPTTTFLKVRLPPTPKRNNDEFNQQDLNERVEDFLKFLDAVWEADPSACVPTWYRKIKKEPLHNETPQVIDREFIRPYVSFFYTTTARGGSYIRFKLRHTNDVGEILNHPSIEWLADKRNIYLYEDKIQAVQVSQAGWLAGSINSRGGIRDLESILKNHPFAKINRIDNLEIRVSQVAIDANDRKAPENERVFAMHVYTDTKTTGAVRELCQMIYPAEPQADYPMGRHMRFVPNVSDTRFIRPPEAKAKARQLRDRQRTFLKSVKSTQTSDILQLNRALKVPPYPSLMQTLTTWKSLEYPDENLFVAVEESVEDVSFFYLEKNEEQAEAVIPLLGIVLENEFGPTVWSWFTHNAKVSNAKYKFDKEAKMVINSQENTTGKEWNLGIKSDIAGISLSPSFHIDVGEFNLNLKMRGRPLDDGSIATMGFGRGNPPDVIQEELNNQEDDSTISASLITRKENSGWETDDDTINGGMDADEEATIQGGLIDEIPEELRVSKGMSDKTDESKGNKERPPELDETSKRMDKESTNAESMSLVTKEIPQNGDESGGTTEKEKERGTDESIDTSTNSLITRKKAESNIVSNNGNPMEDVQDTTEGQEKKSEEGHVSNLSDIDDMSIVTRKKEDVKTMTDKETSESKSETPKKRTRNDNPNTGKRSISESRRTKVRAHLKAKTSAIVSPLKKSDTSTKNLEDKEESKTEDSEGYEEEDKIPLIEWERRNKKTKTPAQNNKAVKSKLNGDTGKKE